MLEVTPQEVDEYYSPKDFQLGQTVRLLGRNFLLYDCDAFTKQYYQKNHPNMEMRPVEPPKTTDELRKTKVVRDWEIPPYNGFGTLEDSLQNWYHLYPVAAKVNCIKALENSNIVLRYCARLVSRSGQRLFMNETNRNRSTVICFRHFRTPGFLETRRDASSFATTSPAA